MLSNHETCFYMNKILLTHLMPDCQIFGLFSVIRKYIHYKRKIYSTVRSKAHPWKHKGIHIHCQIHPTTRVIPGFLQGVGGVLTISKKFWPMRTWALFIVCFVVVIVVFRCDLIGNFNWTVIMWFFQEMQTELVTSWKSCSKRKKNLMICIDADINGI